jgi:hypothetical protein
MLLKRSIAASMVAKERPRQCDETSACVARRHDSCRVDRFVGSSWQERRLRFRRSAGGSAGCHCRLPTRTTGRRSSLHLSILPEPAMAFLKYDLHWGEGATCPPILNNQYLWHSGSVLSLVDWLQQCFIHFRRTQIHQKNHVSYNHGTVYIAALRVHRSSRPTRTPHPHRRVSPSCGAPTRDAHTPACRAVRVRARAAAAPATRHPDSHCGSKPNTRPTMLSANAPPLLAM